MRPYVLTILALMSWLPGRAALADQPGTPASLVPCPFTPEEIEAALGLKVSKGEEAYMDSPAGREVGCLYTVEGGSTTLAVRQTWDPNGPGKAQSAAPKGARGEVIPGDPDNANWRIGGDDSEPRLEFLYTRGKVQTRVLIHGRSFREPEMQPRVLKLKRVP